MTALTKQLQSFVENTTESPFSIYNLPYGVFYDSNNTTPRIGTAIGDYVLDLALLEEKGILTIGHQRLFNHDTLNVFASQGKSVWSSVRRRIQSLLSIDNQELQADQALLSSVLIPQDKITMKLPFKIEGFSDFYASEQHASNVGKLFRGKENPLLPNWKHLPVAYNGRASTVYLSGKTITRPKGQLKPPDVDVPFFAPSKKLDFEIELGVFVGVGNPDGKRIRIEEAADHLFGLVLLNDWSARDIQAFEYQPLGPFLSKSFATSISAWVVPLEALQNVMVPLPKQSPACVEYLHQPSRFLPDIKLKVEIQPRNSTHKTMICETNAKELYWSLEQMIAHHTVNHCVMKPGDLLGTGTISGLNRENWGSLLEISSNGVNPITLHDGSNRVFLEDGDTVIITGYAETPDYKIGFGRVEGMVVSAVQD